MNGILLFKSAFKCNLLALSSGLSRLSLTSSKCIDLKQQQIRCESNSSGAISKFSSTRPHIASNIFSMVMADMGTPSYSTESKSTQAAKESKVSVDEYRRRPMNSFAIFMKKNYEVELKNNPSKYYSHAFYMFVYLLLFFLSAQQQANLHENNRPMAQHALR